MARILVAYATKHSQTQKIAEQLALLLADRGFRADAINVEKDNIFLDKYDGVIVGGPIYIGRYPRGLKKWVKSHASTLTQKHSAFFSVCLGILEKEKNVRIEERKFVEKFFNQTNWYPQVWTIFAGALTYSKYNWFIKLVMKLITRKSGQITVTTQDYEYTNWEYVSRFAERFLFEGDSRFDFRNSCPVELKP